jgi:hypothetical protein
MGIAEKPETKPGVASAQSEEFKHQAWPECSMRNCYRFICRGIQTPAQNSASADANHSLSPYYFEGLLTGLHSTNVA